MGIEWIAVTGSSRIVAEAYDPETETIYVRFPNGVEWQYQACPPQVWEAFTAPGQSRGQYISQVLNYKPNGRYAG
jgi:KTSC domain-containing protein